MPAAWVVEERVEHPSSLHATWPEVDRRPDVRRVAVCRPTARAVVLGSTQPSGVVDAGAAAAAGLDVVRRRSGGGAVLVTPDDPVWLDAWVPAGDPLWSADVTGAFAWLGASWAEALDGVGVHGATVQGSGPGACTRWSSLVCFGGVGAGEVTVDGRKVVGLAQRRDRRGAWFHGACVLHWDPTLLLEVLDLSPGERAAAASGLAGVVTGVVDALADATGGTPGFGPSAPEPATVADALADALVGALPTSA